MSDRKKTLWAGRFKKSLADSAVALSYSLASDVRLWSYDINVNKAHINGLYKAGILNDSEHKKFVRALDEIYDDFSNNRVNIYCREERCYATVKNIGNLQEWSFALPEVDRVLIEEGDDFYWDLKRIVVNEVSPVLMGAGVNTRTLAVKANGMNDETTTIDDKPKNHALSDEPKRFVDQLDETVETVESVISRASKVSDLSQEEGRKIGRRSFRRIKILKDALDEAGRVLTDLIETQKQNPENEANPNDELKRLATGFAEKDNAST